MWSYKPRVLVAPVIFVCSIATVVSGSASAASATSDQRVEVKGQLTPGGWLEARRIRWQEPGRGSKIEGTVRSIDVPRRRLSIGGFTIVVSADASIQLDDSPRALQDVQIGDVVEAKGQWTGNQLDATRLRIRISGPPVGTATDEVEIEADVEWVDEPRRFRVLGLAVELAAGGKVTDERAQVQAPSTAAPSSDRARDRLRRDVDDQQVEPLRVGRWLTIGGRAGADLSDRRDLVGADEGYMREGHVMAQMLSSATFGKYVELYTKVGGSRPYIQQQPNEAPARQLDLRLYEAYLAVGPASPVGFQVGRQRFRDGREWFFDDYLDAVRVHAQMGPWRAEAAIAESIFSGPKELRDRAGQRQTIASLSQQVGERSEAAAFVIARDDRNRGERPMWIGGEWNGRVTRSVKTWAVAAMRRGESSAGRLGGWAVDTGVARRWRLMGTPSVAFGYATATGDADGSDGVDRRFRQTGLDDNRARFFGVKRFAQYGEVLDPELSNLNVFTVGSGLRPWSRTSLDLVYHGYTQRELRRSLPSNRLDAVGTGRSTRIGDALDLIVSVQEWRRVDLSFVVGAFRPGVGVTSPSSTIVYWKPEIRMFF